jgi:ABC-type branched-subunit amino acid transport system substrate-binding protein
MPSKIGFLLPSSEVYPLLITDFLNGFKFSYSQSNLPIPDFHFEGIGNGTDASILRVAEKTIIQENIDLLVGFSGTNHLEKLLNLAKIYQKSFIHTDFGGTIIREEVKNEYGIHHSFNLWKSLSFSGLYAGKNIGKRVAVINSFYEAGYQLLYGFMKGFEQVGGEIVSMQVAKSDYKNYDFDTMLDTAMASNPDFIFSNFTHKESEILFQKMKEKGVLDKLPVVYNPFANHVFSDGITTKNDIYAISTYFMSDENDWEISFKEKYKKVPNEIALLGYESGLLAIKTAEKDPSFEQPIYETLKNEAIISPRGEIGIDAHNETTFDSISIKKSKDNLPIKLEKYSVNDTLFAEANFENNKNSEVFGGWYNPYLCT